MVRLLGDLRLIIDLFIYIQEWYNDDGIVEVLKPHKDGGTYFLTQLARSSLSNQPSLLLGIFLPPLSWLEKRIWRSLKKRMYLA